MILRPDIEQKSRDEINELQSLRLQKTVHRLYERVPFHRRRMDEAGTLPSAVRGIQDITRLSFMQKTDLRDQYPYGLFAEDLSNVARLHASSGTKGKPTLVGYTEQDLKNWAEIVARAIASAGGRPGDIFHNAYGYGLFTGGLGLHYGLEKIGALVVPMSGGNSTRQIQMIMDLQPRGIACTPSYMLNLAEEMRRQGIDPRKTSMKYGIFGAEPWSEEMRSQIEDIFEIKAIDIYGLSEVMGPGVAIECHEAQNGLHIAEDHFLVEVVDPATGEVLPYGTKGELVFTSLTKEAFPVLRYRTGDIASLHPEPCPCGRTTIRMSRVQGRVDDMLIIRGVNVFPGEIESILLRFKELAPHYQLYVTRDGAMDQLEVRIELAISLGAGPGALEERVSLALQKELSVRMRVTLLAPGSIPRGEGKAQRVIDQRLR